LSRDSSGRISKCAIDISKHVIDFEKRSAIKLHTLADFITEWTVLGSAIEGLIPESPWLVYCDGAWGAVGTGAATILISPSRMKLLYAASL
jgi:hypothetical protein